MTLTGNNLTILWYRSLGCYEALCLLFSFLFVIFLNFCNLWNVLYLYHVICGFTYIMKECILMYLLYECFVWVCVYTLHACCVPGEVWGGIGFTGTAVLDAWELPCRCWEPILRPLREQQMFWTSESSLLPIIECGFQCSCYQCYEKEVCI